MDDDAAEHLDQYIGDYTSTLNTDSNGFSTWESTSSAIWWFEGAWRIGPKTAIGSGDAKIVSLSPQACPHKFFEDDEWYGQTDWKYENSQGAWIDTNSNDIFTVPGNCH